MSSTIVIRTLVQYNSQLGHWQNVYRIYRLRTELEKMQHIGDPATDSKGQDRLKAVADLLEHGLTPTETGRRLGLSRGRVSQIVRAHELVKPVGTGGRPLREKEARLLAFVRDFTARHSYPPTIREITQGCNISSTSVADYNLRQPEEMECLTQTPGKARSILLTGQGRARLPLPTGSPASESAA